MIVAPKPEDLFLRDFRIMAMLMGIGMICMSWSFAIEASEQYAKGGPLGLSHWWRNEKALLTHRAVVAYSLYALKGIIWLTAAVVYAFRGWDALLSYIEYAAPYLAAVYVGEAMKGMRGEQPLSSQEVRRYAASLLIIWVGYVATVVHNHSVWINLYAMMLITAFVLMALILRRLSTFRAQHPFKSFKDALAWCAITLSIVSFSWMAWDFMTLSRVSPGI